MQSEFFTNISAVHDCTENENVNEFLSQQIKGEFYLQKKVCGIQLVFIYNEQDGWQAFTKTNIALNCFWGTKKSLLELMLLHVGEESYNKLVDLLDKTRIHKFIFSSNQILQHEGLPKYALFYVYSFEKDGVFVSDGALQEKIKELKNKKIRPAKIVKNIYPKTIRDDTVVIELTAENKIDKLQLVHVQKENQKYREITKKYLLYNGRQQNDLLYMLFLAYKNNELKLFVYTLQHNLYANKIAKLFKNYREEYKKNIDLPITKTFFKYKDLKNEFFKNNPALNVEFASFLQKTCNYTYFDNLRHIDQIQYN